MNSSGDKIEIIELEEEEVDWINPQVKSVNCFPDELMNSTVPTLSDRILRKPNSDLFLIYYSDKLFLFNSSNMDSITIERIKGRESILNTNSLCIINFGKEIIRITINPYEPDYFCIIFENSIQVFGFTELTRYIGTPLNTKIILKPAMLYDLPTTQKGEIYEAYVFDSIDLKIILASKKEIILVSSDNQIVSSPKYKNDINNLLVLEGGIIIASSGDNLHILSYSEGSKTFPEIKFFNIHSILQEQEGNEYKISYLAQFKSFLCVGILQKPEDSEWNDFPQISQNFLFFDYSIDMQTFNLKNIHKSEWVFNYNDDYEFKIEPRYQSVFYEEYNLFILTSNQYHQAEIFYLEDDIDGDKIVRGSFEDDKRIFVPKNKKIDKMSLCQGIGIIDFKHEGYEREKLTLNSEEIFTPPLVILCNDIGNLVVYYLANQRDFKCVLKEKFKIPQNILNRSYDSIQEEKNKLEVKGNLFGSLNFVPPNKISIPESLKDSPKVLFTKYEKKENVNVLADCFKFRKEMVETQTTIKLEKNVINVKEEGKKISTENTKLNVNLNPPSTIKKDIPNKNTNKNEKNITNTEEATNMTLTEEKNLAENEAEQLRKNQELRRSLKFEKLSTNLKRQLDLYKEVITYHSIDMLELLKSLDKKVNLTKSENDLNKFITISDKACKEFFSFNSMIPEFKKYQDKINYQLSQKELIDKIAQNADKANPNLLNIDSFLLSYHRDRDDNSLIGDKVDLSELKNEMTYRLPILNKKIEQLKIFIVEFKKFQSEFDEMSSINKKIKNKNKYDGIFKKFKSVTAATQEENLKSSITPSKLNDLENYSIESQSSLYESIMKKFEEVFIQLDHTYFEKLKPKLEKVLYESKRQKQNKESKISREGFSMSNLDISYTYTKIKEDSSYLGTNPMDNILFYQELVGKFSNIFHNNNPRVTQVNPKAKSRQNLDDFFIKQDDRLKENRTKEAEGKTLSENTSIQSQNYLQKVLDKVKKKKEERDKIKLDLDFNIEEFCKVEKERMSAASIAKDNSSEMPNMFSRNDLKEKSAFPLNNDIKKNNVGIFEKEKVKEEEKKKTQVESKLFSGANANLFKAESKEEKPKINTNVKTEKEKLKEGNEKEKSLVDEKQNKKETTFSLMNNPKETQFKSDQNKNQNLLENKSSSNLFGGVDTSKFSLTKDDKNTFPVQSDNKNIFSTKKNDNDIKQSNINASTGKAAETKPSENIAEQKKEKANDINSAFVKKEESNTNKLPKEPLTATIEPKIGSHMDFLKISENKPNVANILSTPASTDINNPTTPSKSKEEKTLLTKAPEPLKMTNSFSLASNSTNVTNAPNANNFNNISLSNNIFSNKPPLSTMPLVSANQISASSNPPQVSIVHNSQPIDFMNKPGFGAKPNLGMTNPLNNFSMSSPGNASMTGIPFGISGNNNTASFSQFSKNSTGMSSFTGVNQNQQTNFLNQNQPSNQTFGGSFNKNQTTQQTSGLANFQTNNNNNFFNNPSNQQTTGFSNMQASNNNGFNASNTNNNQVNSFGSNQNNLGNNNSNNFIQPGNGGNNFVQTNPNVGKNKNMPDYDLF